MSKTQHTNWESSKKWTEKWCQIVLFHLIHFYVWQVVGEVIYEIWNENYCFLLFPGSITHGTPLYDKKGGAGLPPDARTGPPDAFGGGYPPRRSPSASSPYYPSPVTTSSGVPSQRQGLAYAISGVTTNSIIVKNINFKKSLICLEGKSMTPHRGNTILFFSSQQLPRLRLWPLKGIFSRTQCPSRALDSPCACASGTT